ncbi:MAG: heme-binding protein [Xanthomonadales bacterium]|nr:heme-binding protein [Xanthomonadales bacterium]
MPIGWVLTHRSFTRAPVIAKPIGWVSTHHGLDQAAPFPRATPRVSSCVVTDVVGTVAVGQDPPYAEAKPIGWVSTHRGRDPAAACSRATRLAPSRIGSDGVGSAAVGQDPPYVAPRFIGRAGWGILLALVASLACAADPRPEREGGLRGQGADLTASAPQLRAAAAPAICASCVQAAGLEASQTLSAAEVGQVIAQAVAQARADTAVATIAVVDRVGNVLGVYAMSGSARDLRVASTATGAPAIDGGLEGIVLPAAVGGPALAAIAKAVTGAYLSSGGNAFSTRTASQIVQQHFNPGELNQPGGPLFGVQFSQLACSDFMRRASLMQGMTGPKRSPLGLSADPGGFPLYKQGVLVGGVGVSADGRYTLDPSVADFDQDLDERIALAATLGFDAPRDIQASRITVDGKVLRFSDASAGQLASGVAGARFSALNASAGSLLDVPGYGGGALRGGSAFGLTESGLRLAPAAQFGGSEAFVWVDAFDAPRHPPRAGSETAAALSEAEVTALLAEALTIADASRAQIRRPLGSNARVSIAVVDSRGEILGMVRSRDAPVFGADVSLQKARSAAFFSAPNAGDFIRSLSAPTVLLDANLAPRRTIDLRPVAAAFDAFLGRPALDGSVAFSARSIGNLARPFYPDGILTAQPGPLSAPRGQWSPFATGFQLDLALNGIVQHVAHTADLPGFANDTPDNCAGVALGSGASTAPSRQLANGLQIFPGGVPVYRGDRMIGAVGVSGDGIDQDDMIAFLAVHRAGLRTGGGLGNAPPARRADQLAPQGARLRYVQCPYAPFLGSNAQNVCAGL